MTRNRFVNVYKTMKESRKRRKQRKAGHDFDGTLTRFYITTYKAKLMEENYEVNTINKKINSLSSFNQFLVDEGFMQQMVVHGKKDKIKVASGSEKEVDVFTKEETERLLFFLEDKKVSKRNKLIVFLLLYTGVRVNELVNIQLKDMDLLTRQLKVYGKGGKYREVPLKNELIELIQDYLSTERKESRYSDGPFLLVSQRQLTGNVLVKLLLQETSQTHQISNKQYQLTTILKGEMYYGKERTI